MATGIQTLQTARCIAQHGQNSSCRCVRTHRAWYYDKWAKRKIVKNFKSDAEAKSWRAAQVAGIASHTHAPRTGLPTLAEAARDWLDAAEDGKVLSRHRTAFKPHTLRDYRSALERLILPNYGALPLDQVTAVGLQKLVDDLNGAGASGSTVCNIVAPLQSIFRREHRTLKRIAIDPTDGLELPSRRGETRDALTPRDAAALIEALPAEDRPLWSAAFYLGMRSGELQALRVADVDLAACTVNVESGWDARMGRQAPKSEAGERTIPLPASLAEVLREHVATSGRSGADLLFGRTARSPFTHSNMLRRARTAWAVASVGSFLRSEPGDLQPSTFHVARHSYSTWLDAAGISPSRSDRYLGHSRAGVAERYRHLLPDQLREDALRIDEYLRGSATGKIATLRATG